MKALTSLCLIASALTLIACSPLTARIEGRGLISKVISADVRVKDAAAELTEAARLTKSDPPLALKHCLESGRLSYLALKENPKEAQPIYNLAVEKLFGLLRDQSINPWAKPLRAGDFALSYRGSTGRRIRPEELELIPVNEIDLTTRALETRSTRNGIGAPLIGISSGKNVRLRNQQPLRPHSYISVTAVAHFSGHRCELELLDPMDVETVSVKGRSFPAAADFSASYACLMADEMRLTKSLPRLFDPGRFAQTARIVRLSPYDPKRTPILLVHGLLDPASSWTPLVNALRDDPFTRRHCQIWVYTYPSGYPYPYSAALLREELDKLKSSLPGHKPVIYVGHSMGGLIGRLMLTDSGDSLWNESLLEQPGRTDHTPEEIQFMRDLFVFRHRDDISRAVFISTPHRGAKLAANPASQMAARLVKTPALFIGLGKTLTQVLQRDEGAYRIDHIPCSIDTLSPSNPFVKAIDRLPIAQGIQYHTITGDRGRGDSPKSSDGFVPYASSHLEGASSELIVPSGHRAHRHPMGIREVLRIVRSHILAD
jgi:pimeloyl-ACP methyl ester carboxylesterase